MIETGAAALDAVMRSAHEADAASALFALLCERRGWSAEYLRQIENEEHEPLKDCDVMVDVLEQTRLAGKTIAIAPDFDMDGISSGVLGYAGLKELGFNVELHMPDYNRGHDLSVLDIDEIAQRFPHTSVLLTCDGGVNSHAGIAAASARGWTTLVTDHHQELEPGCNADVTVNPCRIDETYANRGICGAHVLYQVLEAYTAKYQPYKIPATRLLRLFAGTGTVSDVMPVLFENRQMIRDSLSIARLLWSAPPAGENGRPDPAAIDIEAATMMQLLRREVHDPAYVSAFEGFAVMLKAFAEAGKIRDVDSIDEGFYGFYLAPAMNAPRRTQAPLADCFEVFTEPRADLKLEAARRILENNEHRKQMTIFYTDQLATTDQPLAPWVYFSDAPKGMLGLLAAQMMQRTGSPVVVMNRPVDANATISGSGRAPAWFEIISALADYEGVMAIGHQQACGVRAEGVAALATLAQVLEQHTALLAASLDASELVTSADLILGPAEDCDADLIDLEPLMEVVRRIENLKPFGYAFTVPTFQIVIEPTRIRLDRIGRDSQHLRLTTRDGLACLWWNAAEENYERLKGLIEAQRDAVEDSLDCGGSVPPLGYLRFNAKLQLNHFNGNTRLQAVIDELVETPAELEIDTEADTEVGFGS